MAIPVLCGSLSKFASPLGAAMHNAAYRAQGLSWHYVPFEIDDLRAALDAMRTLGIRGLGISMPFKLEIMPLLDDVDPLAARIGAVNTVVNEGGRLFGHNTDWVGATRALEEQMAVSGKRILVLGAGGAARAVAFGVLERGARVSIANRTQAKATALAEEVGAEVVAWAERHDGPWDVVVNATSAGMSEVDPTAPFDVRQDDVMVMDIVYKPLDTELVRAARAAGATTIRGDRMLLHQAARQHELYTGRDAPLAAMDAALAI